MSDLRKRVWFRWPRGVFEGELFKAEVVDTYSDKRGEKMARIYTVGTDEDKSRYHRMSGYPFFGPIHTEYKNLSGREVE